MNAQNVLFTGGSGLLGGAVRRLLPAALFPSSAEFNVANYEQMSAYVEKARPTVIVHAAAFTSPPKVDKDPTKALEVNIVGTANIVRQAIACKARLIYVSTDYVFRGDKGHYTEDDPVSPVNKYAWSKLGGECAVRMYDNSLIVRTSFGPSVFPYEKAFSDQWTSRESVDVFAQKLVRLIASDAVGVIHVGGPRRTVHEYALSLNSGKEIKPLSIHEINFKVPVDTSLDTRRYQAAPQS